MAKLPNLPIKAGDIWVLGALQSSVFLAFGASSGVPDDSRGHRSCHWAPPAQPAPLAPARTGVFHSRTTRGNDHGRCGLELLWGSMTGWFFKEVYIFILQKGRVHSLKSNNMTHDSCHQLSDLKNREQKHDN